MEELRTEWSPTGLNQPRARGEGGISGWSCLESPWPDNGGGLGLGLSMVVAVVGSADRPSTGALGKALYDETPPPPSLSGA